MRSSAEVATRASTTEQAAAAMPDNSGALAAAGGDGGGHDNSGGGGGGGFDYGGDSLGAYEEQWQKDARAKMGDGGAPNDCKEFDDGGRGEGAAFDELGGACGQGPKPKPKKGTSGTSWMDDHALFADDESDDEIADDENGDDIIGDEYGVEISGGGGGGGDSSGAWPRVAPPTQAPTPAPTPTPTLLPTQAPTAQPSHLPSPVPTVHPRPSPSPVPTFPPTPLPTLSPSPVPSPLPSLPPSPLPTSLPTLPPTPAPSPLPSPAPTPLLRSYQAKCLCASAKLSRALGRWCPGSVSRAFVSAEPRLSGDRCLTNATVHQIEAHIRACPPLQTARLECSAAMTSFPEEH
mmetsp:Transcript_3375/g.7824  ORF Transcript_3375/g.7824 Transcript_3375/m.7824 type:complete len:348 (+) Transcript_3375:108-1151(+)